MCHLALQALLALELASGPEVVLDVGSYVDEAIDELMVDLPSPRSRRKEVVSFRQAVGTTASTKNDS